MTCISQKCGIELPEGAAFCHACGVKQKPAKRKRDKQSHGAGTYSVRGNSVMLRVTTELGVRKSFSGRTKKECRQKYDDYLSGEEKKIEKISTVGEWAEKWLEVYKKDKVVYGTYRNYKLYVYNHIIPDLGDLRLDRVRPVHIAEFFSDPRRTGLSESAKKHINIALKGIFNTAVKNKYCIESPVDASPSSERKPEEEIQVFSVGQVESIIRDASTHRFGVYALLPLYTGMRMGEILSMKWNDIDFDSGLITIRSASTRVEHGRDEKYPKGGKVRTIGISEAFEPILRGIPHKGIYVLCGDNSRPISPSTYSRRYKAFFDETGNYYLSPHKCRHTYGTYLLRGGVDLRNVQIALGHSTPLVTAKYTHPDTEDVKNNIKKLNY